MMRDAPARPLLAYYGDDFTGSTDVMEALARAGVRTALFLDTPGPDRLTGRFADLQAIGVAGTSRSMTPEQMETALPPVFEGLGLLKPEIVHYKVCSTFDSSSEIGSIGRAIDIGQRVFASTFVPLVVGAPILRRYCVFGNLFATAGAETYRLDRHPTMRCHPVTPMNEADLRLHVGRQTDRNVGLIDILHLFGDPIDIDRHFVQMVDSGVEVVLFDVLDEPRLAEVGRLIWSHRGEGGPLFAVGSSGLEYALVAHWRAAGRLPEAAPIRSPGPVDRLLVVSGSCSPTTRDQIRWALENGFEGIAADAARLADPEYCEAERAEVIRQAAGALEGGSSVVVYSALGPDDPRILTGANRDRIGEQLGEILRALLKRTGLRRAVVAGGDTSGHALSRLEIDALEFLISMAPGSPLCRASSSQAGLDGLEIVLKGGQVGQVDFFGRVMEGVA